MDTVIIFLAYVVVIVLDAIVYACVVVIAGPRRNYWPLSGFYELVKLANQHRNIDKR